MGQAVLELQRLISDSLAVSTFYHAWFKGLVKISWADKSWNCQLALEQTIFFQYIVLLKSTFLGTKDGTTEMVLQHSP